MKKRLKVICVLLLCVTCIFAGCGKKENNIEIVTFFENQELEENKEVEEADVYVQPEMKGEITISCFYEQEFLMVAAEQFMKEYPDVKVTINVYKDTSETGSMEDYLTYLNTKIMTEKAEDIFFNSFLPVAKYSEMGVFEDLSNYILCTPQFREENYFMNVLQAAKQKNGGIYLLPYIAKFECIGFSEDLLTGKEDIQAFLKNQKSVGFSESMNIAKSLVDDTRQKNRYLIQMNEVAYMDYLIKDKFCQFIDMDAKQVRIDSEEYIKLLESVKELSKANYFGSEIDFYNTEYEFAAICDFDVQSAFYTLDSKETLSYSVPLADSKGNVVLNANGCIALNHMSEHKDLAWEFMKYILSDKIQSLPSVHGLPVNRKGFGVAVERYYDYYADGKTATVEKKAYQNLLESWMEQINSCDTVDGVLWTLIEGENSNYFSGRQTAVDTARILQKKIERYFNE